MHYLKIHWNSKQYWIGILIGGIGQGESLEERTQVINLVKDSLKNTNLPLFIQGVQSIEEV